MITKAKHINIIISWYTLQSEKHTDNVSYKGESLARPEAI